MTEQPVRGVPNVPHEHREAAVQHLQTLFDVGVVAGMSDGQLLEQFARWRGEAAETAFAALVTRHGSMVFHVCRGIVGNDHDAQDAFQATFLILARKGSSLCVRDSIAPWLHRVARRAAGRLRMASNRQRAIERRAAEFAVPQSELQWPEDWAQMLHEEVDRLPGCFRLPIVLCDLEGHSYEAAARFLGCPIGTVKSRLARGRDRLRGRLARRGFSPTAGPLGVAVPVALVCDTISTVLSKATIQGVLQAKTDAAAASATFSVSVTALSERVLKDMLLTRLKTAVAVTLAAGVSITGIGLLASVASGTPAPIAQEAGLPKDETPKPSTPVVKSTTTAANSTDLAPQRKQGMFEASRPVITTGDSRKIWAYNPDTNTWHTYKAPEGVSVSEIRFPRLIALNLTGESIKEVAVFSTKTGKWSRQPLAEPATTNSVQPLLRSDYAVYIIDRHAYAFSAVTGKWSQVTLEMRNMVPLIDGDFQSFMMLRDAQNMHAYSALTGTWQTMKTERGMGHPLAGPSGTAIVVNGGRLYSFDPRKAQFEEVKAEDE
jgi:RNA polymerase sigma factor (sigma-70 family)